MRLPEGDRQYRERHQPASDSRHGGQAEPELRRADHDEGDGQQDAGLPRPSLQGAPGPAGLTRVDRPGGVVVGARTLPAQPGQAEVDPGAGMVRQAAQRLAVGGLREVVLTSQQREVTGEDVRIRLLRRVADGSGRLGPRLAPAPRHPAQRGSQAHPRGPGARREAYGLLGGRHGLRVAAEPLEREAGQAVSPVRAGLGAGVEIQRPAGRLQRGLGPVAAQPRGGHGAPLPGVGGIPWLRNGDRGGVALVLALVPGVGGVPRWRGNPAGVLPVPGVGGVPRWRGNPAGVLPVPGIGRVPRWRDRGGVVSAGPAHHGGSRASR